MKIYILCFIDDEYGHRDYLGVFSSLENLEKFFDEKFTGRSLFSFPEFKQGHCGENYVWIEDTIDLPEGEQ